jgi:hypothetical protein
MARLEVPPELYVLFPCACFELRCAAPRHLIMAAAALCTFLKRCR